MKKIIPYLIFINCKGKDTSGDQTILPRDENNKENNPDNKDILNQNYIRNKEILDRINKIYISASTPKRDFTKEEWNEIQELKIEYQKNNQEEIKNHVLPSKELNFNEKKIESIKKEAQTKKIFVGIDKLIPGMPINIFFGLYPIPFENFKNENEEIIIIEEIKGKVDSYISTIENFKKFYKKEIRLLEFFQKANFFDEDGNLCSFIKKDFSKTETDQGYHRIKINPYLILIEDETTEYIKYLKEYIDKNKNKNFIISIPSEISQNDNIDFFENFKECQNCYWEDLIIEEYKSLFKNVKNCYLHFDVKHLFYMKEGDILYFQENNEFLNKKIEKGKIISVEDFLKNLNLKSDEKIKLKNFSSSFKEIIKKSGIYQKYKDYFEFTSE
jgi:hypothetical protein